MYLVLQRIYDFDKWARQKWPRTYTRLLLARLPEDNGWLLIIKAVRSTPHTRAPAITARRPKD